jgi:hypothetical protein
MALRSRLRRAFTRGSQDDPDTLTKTSSKTKTKSPKTDPNVYGPGDKMPPLKYRRPVAPEHKAHLEAFNWAQAWRRRSDPSVYSPMGSRMPSRRSSFQSYGRRSFARSRKSFSRNDDDESAVDSGFGASVDGDDRPDQLREGSDEEGDVTNGTSSQAMVLWLCRMLIKHSRPFATSHKRPAPPPKIILYRRPPFSLLQLTPRNRRPRAPPIHKQDRHPIHATGPRNRPQKIKPRSHQGRVRP